MYILLVYDDLDFPYMPFGKIYYAQQTKHSDKLSRQAILKQSPSFIYNILNCNAKFITSGQFIQ